MRVNGKELGRSSLLWQHEFEGVLMLREKKGDLLFKHGHVLSEHWCRLRGNLLLICRNTDRHCTELHSLVVLEFHEVNEAPASEASPSGFYISFPKFGDPSLFFVARNSNERAQWMQVIRKAGLQPILTRTSAINAEIDKLRDTSPLLRVNKTNIPPGRRRGMGAVDEESSLTNYNNNGISSSLLNSQNSEGFYNSEIQTSSTLPRGYVIGEENFGRLSADVLESVSGGLELTLSCRGLPHSTSEILPNSCVTVYVRMQADGSSSSETGPSSSNPQINWIQIGRTEIVERNVNPDFSKTIFLPAEMYNHTAIVKFNVWDVRELKSCISQSAGTAEVEVTALENNSSITLRLRSYGEEQRLGSISIRTAHRLPLSESGLSRLDFPTVHLRSLCVNVLSKNFSFPHVSASAGASGQQTEESFLAARHSFSPPPAYVRPDGHMKVIEIMGESKLGHDIPVNFLKCLIQSERLLYDSLMRAATNSAQMEMCRADLIVSAKRELEFFENSLRVLSEYSGPPFKRSSDKSSVALEFMPVNLHVNRMAVMDLQNHLVMHHDIVTVGSFSAHCRGFSSSVGGGLQRLAASHNESCELDHSAGVALRLLQQGCQCAFDLQCELISWSKTVIDLLMEGAVPEDKIQMTRFRKLLGHLKRLAQDPFISGRVDFQPLEDVVSQLQDALRQSNAQVSNASNNPYRAYIDRSTQRLGHLLEQAWQEAIARDCLWPKVLKSVSPCSQPLSEETSATASTFNFKPSGPEAQRLQVSASTFTSSEGSSGTVRTAAGPPPPISTEDDPNDADSPIRSSLSAATSIVSTSQLPNPGAMLPADLWMLFQTRASICLSQALTAMLTGLMNDFARWSTETWQQMSVCGVPLYFEGILSCYLSEYGMLEDMFWTVRSLAYVKVTVKPQSAFATNAAGKGSTSSQWKPQVLFLGRRECVVSCPDRVWALAPESIQTRRQVRLHLHPIMFNVGINEMQTVAEKLKSVEIQRTINAWGFEALKQYFDRYVKNFQAPKATPDGLDVVDALANLRHELSAHRSKPITVLYLAEQMSHSLNALRFTSCKSAKDRTAMAITLEWVRWLKGCAGLPQGEPFQEALKCLRSTGSLRTENTFKNVGARHFAFSTMQLFSFPKLYRPPTGTYGGTTET